MSSKRQMHFKNTYYLFLFKIDKITGWKRQSNCLYDGLILHSADFVDIHM